MSKLDDYINDREKKIKEKDPNIADSKLGKFYQKNLEKYKEYKKQDENYTPEDKKELKKYYIEQTILILIAIALIIFIIIRMTHLNR